MRTIRMPFLIVLATILILPSQSFAAPDITGNWYVGQLAGENAMTLRGLAFDNAGNIIVADDLNNVVYKIDVDQLTETHWGTTGTLPGQFRGACALAAGKDGSVFVADMWNDRVQKFDSCGNLIMTWGTSGQEAGQFRCARGIAVGSGRVYVADALNGRVQVFTEAGAYLSEFGEWGSGPGEFGRNRRHGDDIERDLPGGLGMLTDDTDFTMIGGPGELAVNRNGDIYVLDPCNHRVLRFSADGVFLNAIGSEGHGERDLFGPQGVTVGSADIVYVADTGNRRIQMYAPTGTYLGGLDQFQLLDDRKIPGERPPGDDIEREFGALSHPNSDRYFSEPVSVGWGHGEQLFVADRGDGHLRSFRFPSNPARLSYDILPSQCPNRWDMESNGDVVVAIAGRPGLAATDLNPASLFLDGSGFAGAANFHDLTSFRGANLGCGPQGADGYMDLVLKFSASAFRNALEGSQIGSTRTLTVAGAFNDGTPVWGTDEVILSRDVPDTRDRRPGDDIERVSYHLPMAAAVTINVYDVQGRMVDCVLDEVQSAGNHVMEWKTDHYRNGVYFYRLRAGNTLRSHRLVVVH